MKKRIAALLIALCLVVGLVPSVSAATLDNGLEYEVYEDYVVITGYDGTATELVIPAEIEGKPVTTIGESAFDNSDNLISVVISDGIITIGEWAFSDCNNLTNVVIPNSVTSIDDGAFAWCYDLTTMVIPDSVASIDWWTFYDCNSLTNVVIGSNVTFIASEAFAFCYDLSSIYFRGDAPKFALDPFFCVTATAYYPANNSTWTKEVRQDYHGTITWVPYNPNNPFLDVPADSFYHDPVMWAIEKGITNGLTATEFGPNATCNRAQVVTFLWRAAGSPEPETTTHDFVDVQAGSFYEKPVLWAVEKGITTGSDATHFNPTGDCNRAQVVTFIYRAFESPAVENADNPFTDVPEKSWYTAPVLWAVENGITNGLSATTFGPTQSCNRAQVVTFLYRAYN